MIDDSLSRPLRDALGDIDIYLVDQLLRSRISSSMRVLDAGCGNGRNLVYLMRHGIDACAVDVSEEAIAEVRALAHRLAPGLPDDNFRVEAIETMSFAPESFDVVISNAVLHFSQDVGHFNAVLDGMWRVLAPGGMLWARLASSIGIEGQIESIGDRRHRLPDGSERFLVDEAFLTTAAQRRGAELMDPLKTVVVSDRRSMSTWCIRKKSA